MLDSLRHDLLYALRTLRRKPTFTAAAILALGLGVGANTAIFSVFDAVLLRPLPYSEPDRLVYLWERNPESGEEHSRISPVTYADVREQVKSFEAIAGWWIPDLNLTSEGAEPLRVRAIATTDNFFNVLGAPPSLGRGFLPGEDERGRDPIVVIGHGLWQRRFGADPGIVGRKLDLDGTAHEIVGVAPPGFDFPEGTELWHPLGWNPAQHSRNARFFFGLARLAPGATLGQAQSEVDTLTETWRREQARTNAGWYARVVGLEDDLVGDLRPALWLLLAAVALVLLIACANVANLLLAQAVGREREVAVRAALGASSWRLVRQLLTESLVLAFAGGALGLLLAWRGIPLLLALAPPELPRLEGVAVDTRVLLFTLGATLAAGLTFGLAPAWQSARTAVAERLQEGTRGGTAGVRRGRLRSLLVVSEIALAMMLLIGAGLLVRSFWRLLAENPGFQPERTLTFNLQLPDTKYGSWAEVTDFYQRLDTRLEAVAGVEAAAATAFKPLEMGWTVDVAIVGREAPREGEEPRVQYHSVTPGSFHVLGVPLLAGRDFNERDLATAPPVVILNQTAVRRYFRDEDPLGEHVAGGARAFGPLGRVVTESLEVEVVGVVADVKNTALEKDPEPAMYFPHQQFAYRSMNLVLRTRGEPKTLAAAIRGAVWELDRQLPIAGIKTLEEHLGAAVARRRFVMLLLACFAGLALVLAAIGTYGVLSQVAAQRRREIAVRVALGARRADVLRLLVGQGMALAFAGIALGVVGAFALRRLVAGLLFGVGAGDPLTFLAVALLLGSAAFLACYLPAQRAARVDPLAALRSE